jgi:hypothetical protein
VCVCVRGCVYGMPRKRIANVIRLCMFIPQTAKVPFYTNAKGEGKYIHSSIYLHRNIDGWMDGWKGGEGERSVRK